MNARLSYGSCCGPSADGQADWRRPAFGLAARFLLAGALACMAGAWPKTAAGSGLPADADGAGRPARAASATDPLAALRLPAGSRQEWLGDGVWLHGAPARVLVFDAPRSASELIRLLSAQQPALTDLNVLPGQAILSGRVGHEDWIVRLESQGPRRTAGSIAMIGNRAAAAGRPAPAWLPAGGRLRLDIAVRDQGITVTDRIWQYGLPAERVASRLAAGLRQDGWLRMPSDGGTQWWNRGGARLRVSLVPLDGGSGLMVSGWTP